MKFTQEAHSAAMIETHLAQHAETKLHIGCGRHVLPGWLNCDLVPKQADIVMLDATARFPFEDEVFDLVFSEHMIEHVPYEGGLNMLRESYRVLKRGGQIRISTPDLRFLVDLYACEKTPLQKAYMQWAAQRFVPSGTAAPAFVINSFVRNWGHQFIYDEETLRQTMEEIGFVDIFSCNIKKSTVPAFQDLEHDGRMPPGFLQLETMTLEARKP